MSVTIDGNTIPGTFMAQVGAKTQRTQTNVVAGTNGATGKLMGTNPRHVVFDGHLHNSFANVAAVNTYLGTLDSLVNAKTRGTLTDGNTGRSWSNARFIGYDEPPPNVYGDMPGDGRTYHVVLIFEVMDA